MTEQRRIDPLTAAFYDMQIVLEDTAARLAPIGDQIRRDREAQEARDFPDNRYGRRHRASLERRTKRRGDTP